MQVRRLLKETDADGMTFLMHAASAKTDHTSRRGAMRQYSIARGTSSEHTTSIQPNADRSSRDREDPNSKPPPTAFLKLRPRESAGTLDAPSVLPITWEEDDGKLSIHVKGGSGRTDTVKK